VSVISQPVCGEKTVWMPPKINSAYRLSQVQICSLIDMREKINGAISTVVNLLALLLTTSACEKRGESVLSKHGFVDQVEEKEKSVIDRVEFIRQVRIEVVDWQSSWLISE
jgi:hypothetical protein